MSANGLDGPRFEPISVKIPEAVRLTGISRSRMYQLIRSGDIEYAKVGAASLILVESLRAFVRGKAAGAATDGRSTIAREQPASGDLS